MLPTSSLRLRLEKHLGRIKFPYFFFSSQLFCACQPARWPAWVWGVELMLVLLAECRFQKPLPALSQAYKAIITTEFRTGVSAKAANSNAYHIHNRNR